jgi:hypothetical protein
MHTCLSIRHLVVRRGLNARQGARARATSSALDNYCSGETMRYNSLSVPLASGSWSCELVPVRDYRSPCGGSLPFIREEERRQLESDRHDFGRYFRPAYDFRRTITRDIDEIRAFVRDCLSLSSQNQLTDNDNIRRILCEAVSSGRIVPVINRERRTPARTARASFAPQSWNEAAPIMRSGSGGGAAPASRSFHQLAMDWLGLDSEGAYAYIEKYNTMVQQVEEVEGRTAAARAAALALSDGGLFGADEAADGSALTALDVGFENSSRLSDSQPFEYLSDMPGGDVDDLAGMPFNGEPNTWISSMPGKMPQLRQFGPNGTPLTDFDLEAHHGNPNPHAHNWDGGGRDDGAPVSLLPW